MGVMERKAGEAVGWPAVRLGAERVEGVGESAAITAGAEHSGATDGEQAVMTRRTREKGGRGTMSVDRFSYLGDAMRSYRILDYVLEALVRENEKMST